LVVLRRSLPRGKGAVTAARPKLEAHYMAERQLHGGSNSGLTEEEAQEFHRHYMASTIAYVAVAVVAHLLIWVWRPWFT
jgi:light-harvesting complex 1 beta chain